MEQVLHLIWRISEDTIFYLRIGVFRMESCIFDLGAFCLPSLKIVADIC
jgi:hypothetical protein